MKNRILIFLGICLLSSLPALAQTEGWKDSYSRLSENTRFSNPAWITELQGGLTRLSTVKIGFDKEDGGVTDINESDDSWKAGIGAESFMRISDRLWSYGKMSYSYFKGRNMGGPILMNPWYNPINFLESTDTTTGTKILEKYTFEGALAYSLNSRLTLAGKILYETANYAKRSDPRPNNKWMDLDASLGLKYSFKPGGTSIGMNMSYSKTLETIDIDIFGTTDKNYYYLVDYGGIFGKIEMVESDDNYLSTSNERPMLNHFYGGGMQLYSPLTERLALKLDLNLAWRDGYYGKKGSGTVRFCDFTGMRYDMAGELLFRTDRLEQRLRATWKELTSENKENSWSYSTEAGQNTEVQYFGKQKAGDKTVSKLDLTYSLSHGKEDSLPSWGVGAGFGSLIIDQTGIMYPFYRKQKFSTNTARLFALKNFGLRKASFLTISAEADYSFPGDDYKNKDGQYASASGNPRTIDAWLNKSYEYFHSNKLGGMAAIRYTMDRTIKSHKFSFFAEISDTFMRLTEDPEYLTGNYRNKLLITIGCNF
jgi:hypothetical protein